MTVMEAVGTSIDVFYINDGAMYPAEGVRGGGQGGRPGAWTRLTSGRSWRRLPSGWGWSTVGPGEAILSKCCGGGGYGSPLQRSPDRVLHDVLEERVSVERARSVYGVVIVDGEIDEVATAMLRSAGAV